MQQIFEAVTWYMAFLFSVTAHEAAHAWCAKLGGDWTAYHGGQGSLDPLPHIRREPFDMVLLPLVSLFLSERRHRRQVPPFRPQSGLRLDRLADRLATLRPVVQPALYVRVEHPLPRRALRIDTPHGVPVISMATGQSGLVHMDGMMACGEKAKNESKSLLSKKACLGQQCHQMGNLPHRNYAHAS